MAQINYWTLNLPSWAVCERWAYWYFLSVYTLTMCYDMLIHGLGLYNCVVPMTKRSATFVWNCLKCHVSPIMSCFTYLMADFHLNSYSLFAIFRTSFCEGPALIRLKTQIFYWPFTYTRSIIQKPKVMPNMYMLVKFYVIDNYCCSFHQIFRHETDDGLCLMMHKRVVETRWNFRFIRRTNLNELCLWRFSAHEFFKSSRLFSQAFIKIWINGNFLGDAAGSGNPCSSCKIVTSCSIPVNPLLL